MTSTNNNGAGPGQVAPEKTKGTADGQVNNPQNTTNNSADFKSKIIATCARLSGAIGVFDVMFALLTVQFALILWGAFQ